VALDETTTKPLFEFCEPALHSGLVDTLALCRRHDAALVGKRQKVLQVIPGKHVSSMQLCEAITQCCAFPRVLRRGNFPCPLSTCNICNGLWCRMMVTVLFDPILHGRVAYLRGRPAHPEVSFFEHKCSCRCHQQQ